MFLLVNLFNLQPLVQEEYRNNLQTYKRHLASVSKH